MELTTSELQVQVCADTGASTYSFVCPVCALMVNKAAAEPIIETLLDAGVRLVAWDLPAELSEVKVGRPINHDDLLAFHTALDVDGWVDELASTPVEPTSDRTRP